MKLPSPPRLWRHRRVHTPLMLQQEETECGAVSLGIMLAFFGRWVPMEELREACAVNRDGCDARDIARAARRYGLEPQGWRREPEHLRDMEMPLHRLLGVQPFPSAGRRARRQLLRERSG